MKLTIYWTTNHKPTMDKIRRRFGIPPGMNINGESIADIEEADLPLLEETAKRGFLQIRYK